MIRQRAMAGFAVDVGVLAGGLDGQDVGVAGLAGLVAGEVDGVGGDFADGGSAVVAVLPEALGHDEVANDKKHHKGDDEEEGKSEEMSCIFEAFHRAIFLPEAAAAQRNCFTATDNPIDTRGGAGLYVTGRTAVWCWVGGWLVARGKNEGREGGFSGL